ncbi:uncharacterized protein LOC132729428 [Ruditapes philippinarum]|uniref:uncharacterized protein LOC132729428 n=1 Tax=Ruditapes philippinarum TaxID=129788 RepID=UPI00295C1063|nr:uncharacterized protein LOC132729428 [Ruditapes philippinarum]
MIMPLPYFQMMNANANMCKNLTLFDDCGDGGVCVCANMNKVTYNNPGNTPCNNLICRVPECYSITGRIVPPKQVKGKYVYCVTDDDCGKKFVCTHLNYCCRVPRGKYAKYIGSGA